MFLLIGESTLLYEHLRDPRPGRHGPRLHRHPARPSSLGRAALLGPRPAVLHVHRRRGPGFFGGQARGEGRAGRRSPKHVVIRSVTPAPARLGPLLHRAGPHHLPLPERPGPARRDLSHRLCPDEDGSRGPRSPGASPSSWRPRSSTGRSGWRATTSRSSRTTTSGPGWTCSSGELSAGHWVAFNALPTAAHTVWGVLAGQWLMRPRRRERRSPGWPASGPPAVAAGFALTAVSPMIKRICDRLVRRGRPAASASWRWPCRYWAHRRPEVEQLGRLPQHRRHELTGHLSFPRRAAGRSGCGSSSCPFTMAFARLDRGAPGGDPDRRRRLGRACGICATGSTSGRSSSRFKDGVKPIPLVLSILAVQGLGL
ncbi:MAG: hypothetical protein M0C28_47695 [Candidatus Moduliflexus flocculans]|nr:hypothetical protein [Candidatus Moduliflexus flocculans]